MLKLTEWFLQNDSERQMFFGEIEKVTFRLPTQKAFLLALRRICERLASRGYRDVTPLKAEIGATFKD